MYNKGEKLKDDSGSIAEETQFEKGDIYKIKSVTERNSKEDIYEIENYTREGSTVTVMKTQIINCTLVSE